METSKSYLKLLDSVESSVEVSEDYSDEEIYKLVSYENDNNENDVDEDTTNEIENEIIISKTDAKVHSQQLFTYLEQQGLINNEILNSFNYINDLLIKPLIQSKINF